MDAVYLCHMSWQVLLLVESSCLLYLSAYLPIENMVGVSSWGPCSSVDALNRLKWTRPSLFTIITAPLLFECAYTSIIHNWLRLYGDHVTHMISWHAKYGEFWVVDILFLHYFACHEVVRIMRFPGCQFCLEYHCVRKISPFNFFSCYSFPARSNVKKWKWEDSPTFGDMLALWKDRRTCLISWSREQGYAFAVGEETVPAMHCVCILTISLSSIAIDFRGFLNTMT